MRIILPFLVALAVGVAPAAADPVGTPGASSTYTVTCATNGGQTTFHLVGTGAAGHVLENNSIAVLLSADVTRFVDGVVAAQFSFTHPQQSQVPALSCTAFTEFEDAQGHTIRLEFENALILVTPPKP